MEKDFNETVLKALDDKTRWYDEHELPDLVEKYRILLTCVRSLFDSLVKKSIIQNDPYKMDKKISEVKPVDDAPFTDNERNLVVGMRFSDYESMLDYICNYYKFSVARLTLGEIKKHVSTINSFLWTQFNVNNQKVNTRGLAALVFDARQNTDALTASMITDALAKASKAVQNIMTSLKDLTEFQKEVYKGSIRREIFNHPNFDKEKAFQSGEAEMKAIRSLFAQCMGKAPFYNELVDEIIAEDTAPNKAILQKALLEKLNVDSGNQEEKKRATVNTKEMILEAVRALGGLTPQIESALTKLTESHEALESDHNSFKDKIIRLLKKAFNVQEKPKVYQLIFIDPKNDSSHRENVNFQNFTTDLSNHSHRYAALSSKTSPAYQKLSSMSEEKILEYLVQQITECGRLMGLLNAFDDYFKQAAANSPNKAKIKGLKMEVTAMKNSIVKANQRRAEYVAFIEEEAQMAKLGIKNES